MLGPLIAATLLASCAPAAAGWTDAGVHEVDGHWIVGERVCQDTCRVEAEAATEILERQQPGTMVRAVALAEFPYSWRDVTGRTILVTTSGLGESVLVILDLVGAPRRAIGLVCEGPIVDGDLVLERTCSQSELGLYRVGGGPGSVGID